MLLIVKAKPPRMIAGSQYEADSDKIDPGWFSGFKKLPKLDWIGAILVLGTTTCLVVGAISNYLCVSDPLKFRNGSLDYNGAETPVCD
jgi:hypothetical protein